MGPGQLESQMSSDEGPCLSKRHGKVQGFRGHNDNKEELLGVWKLEKKMEGDKIRSEQRNVQSQDCAGKQCLEVTVSKILPCK